jgi:predicted RecB family nuclease
VLGYQSFEDKLGSIESVMFKDTKNNLVYSPSDLMLYMESPFASWMQRLDLEFPGHGTPRDADDPLLNLLAAKGLVHENEFLVSLQRDGKQVFIVSDEGSQKDREDQTKVALASGADVIFQARLSNLPFAGYADFLIKVPGESELGAYHYEPWDTKLARKAKPYFAVQLCCYAEILAELQGRLPENLAVVLGSKDELGAPNISQLRTADYFYYYKNLKKRFLVEHHSFDGVNMPDPGDSRTWGQWSEYAQKLLADRDDLSLVANITKHQIKKLKTVGIKSRKALSQSTDSHVAGINPSVLSRLKNQAAIQVESSGLEKPLFRVIDNEVSFPRTGLCQLPPYSTGDVFWDLEGFPLVDGGLEYLWGAAYFDRGCRKFQDWWAHDSTAEKVAFEKFISWAYARWLSNPKMHIYHYGHYEVSVLRRLMGRYGTKEHEVDQLLRNEVLIDLYPIVRNGLLVGEPSYSLKNVEKLYRSKRDTAVGEGGASMVVYEEWRQDPDGLIWQDSATLKNIRDYNIDDCNSTQELVVWLRDEQIRAGIGYDPIRQVEEVRSAPESSEAGELAEAILLQNGEEGEESLAATMAYSLEFHRREGKPVWWRLFDWLEKTEAELFDDLDCLAGLEYIGEVDFEGAEPGTLQVSEYRFDADQDTKLKMGQVIIAAEPRFNAELKGLNLQEGHAQLKFLSDPLPRINLLPDEWVPSQPIPSAILDVVGGWQKKTLVSSAILDFIERRPPKICSLAPGGSVIPTGTDLIEGSISAALALDQSTLVIQGPPGTGKTYTASHMIHALVRAGYRVGITSNSHKAICNLMLETSKRFSDSGDEPNVLKIGGSPNEAIFEYDFVSYLKSMAGIKHPRTYKLLGSTAWGFCNKKAVGLLDYLFVDEAGQVSIANLIGMSRSTNNIVLMGDQMQLGQPIQGSHPGTSGSSCLEYFMGEHATIPEHMGIFLKNSWRMHPDVCNLVSEMSYDSRLGSSNETKERYLLAAKEGAVIPASSGVVFLPIEHEGNSQCSEEEIVAIDDLISELTQRQLRTAEGARLVSLSDFLFVAPYNAQVRKLQAVLSADAKVGSVDKFQGQEAPIVIISLCASSGESGRGIDFILNKNRMNVAISRAQVLAVVVGSPRLCNSAVNSLKDMRLVNDFCRLTELSC